MYCSTKARESTNRQFLHPLLLRGVLFLMMVLPPISSPTLRHQIITLSQRKGRCLREVRGMRSGVPAIKIGFTIGLVIRCFKCMGLHILCTKELGGMRFGDSHWWIGVGTKDTSEGLAGLRVFGSHVANKFYDKITWTEISRKGLNFLTFDRASVMYHPFALVSYSVIANNKGKTAIYRLYSQIILTIHNSDDYAYSFQYRTPEGN
jgi:hypothetical protein